MPKIREWLINHNLLKDGFLEITGDVPNEIAIKGEQWQLSFEGRTDEIAHSGEGLDALLKLLKDEYKVVLMPNAFDPLEQTDDAVPVVTLDKDAPKELQDLFSKIAPGSVAVAKQRGTNINIYYEGGIYTRKDSSREPTQEERNEYAIIAAGRAKENYPTIAKFTIHMDDVKYLTIVGVVQMMWKPWKVLWIREMKNVRSD